MGWEGDVAWLPTFTCSVGDVVVCGSVCAPYGGDVDVACAVYVIGVENRGTDERTIRVRMEGALGHRQLRVRSARAAEDASRVSRSAKGLVLLEGSAQPGLGALAVGSDGSADISVDGVRFAITRSLTVAAGESAQAALYLAAGPERDAAEATAAVIERPCSRPPLPRTLSASRTPAP